MDLDSFHFGIIGIAPLLPRKALKDIQFQGFLADTRRMHGEPLFPFPR
jgi:hypothetical protein